MTQEQIIELLNRKIKEAIKTSGQDHGHNTEWWRDYYSGVAEGLKEAKSIIGMLDKQNNRLTKQQIIDAGIDYTMQNYPVCITGGVLADMARQMNRNPSFEAGAKWAKEELIKDACE